MKNEQGVGRLPEGVKQKMAIEKDPAAVVFDKIMADVRARKKAGESITFKTHEDYNEWKTLRDANFEKGTLDIANEKAAILKVKEAEAKRVADLEELSIDRFYQPGKKVPSIDHKKQVGALLRGKDSRPLRLAGKLTEDEGGFSGEQAENQIAGILKEMEQLKNVFSIQVKTLGEMGMWAIISGKKAALKEEMKKTTDQIHTESQALLEEFKISGTKLDNHDVIMDNLHNLSKKLEGEVVLGEATVALAVLTAVLVGCTGQVVNKVSAADSFKSSAGASFDTGHGANVSDTNSVIEESQNVQSGVSGYRVFEKPVYLSGASTEVVGNREVFSLTPGETAGVKNFTDWRHQILNHIYIEMNANGSIPTTEKGLNVPVGTKLFVTVNGDNKFEMTVEKGSNIWHEIGQKKKEIGEIGKKFGWNKIGLAVETPTAVADHDGQNKAKLGHHKKSGLHAGQTGEVDKPVVALDAKAELERANQAEVKKFLGTKGVDHVFNQLYSSVDEAEVAYEKLKKVYDETEVHPAVDGRFLSDEDEMKSNIKNTIFKEMQRLKSVDSINLQSTGESLRHIEPKSELIKFSHVPQVEELANEHDLAVRASEKYATPLIDAWYLVSKVDGSLKSSLGVDLSEENARKFKKQANKAKGIYQEVLKFVRLERNAPAKVFITEQADNGLKIAETQVANLDKFIPEKNVADVIDEVKAKFSSLYDRVKDNIGNSALYGKDQVLETVQLVVENTKSSGKISNADKTKLKKLKKNLHIILHSDKSSESDKEIAKQILDIVKDLNQAVSSKDQNETDVADSAGVLYKLPSLPN